MSWVAFVNIVNAASGKRFAILVLVVQTLAIGAIVLRKPWASLAVIAWALLPTLHPILMWLAVLLRGSHSHSIDSVLIQSTLLVLCAFFIVYADPVFKSVSPSNTQST